MKLSIILITENSQKWIGKVIKRLRTYIECLPEVQFVFIDNRSEDDTVPQIVNLINTNFIDEERFKFFINTSKKTIEEMEEMASKIASSENCVIIKKNMNIRQLDKAIRKCLDDTIS